MERDRRNSDDPLQGHLFWSRRGGRDLSAEVDYDRPCTVCGYNLRGMPPKSRCPECGSVGGWNLCDDPVAWDEEQTFGAFASTCFSVIRHPHILARHVWRPARMDLVAARRFRRIALAIGIVSLSLVAFAITSRVSNPATAALSLPFQTVAILVWLNAVTLEPLTRMKDWSSGSSAIARRVQAIVHYTSAPLVLTPLHLVIVWLADDPMDLRWSPHLPWLAMAAIHVSVLIFQLWLGAIALGWLMYELVEMPKVQAQTLALGPIITAMASAAMVLIGVSAMVAMLAWRLVGS